MKNTFFNILIVSVSLLVAFSCTRLMPETKVDLDLTEDLASISYSTLSKQGYRIYNYLPAGYNSIGGAMMAAATDEADHAIVGSSVEKFQNGSWNAVSNPDDVWSNEYEGIRTINIFLHNSINYKTIILRDTSTSSSLNNYKSQCADIEWLRNEAEVMRAYLYFELSKRYGGVPIVDSIYSSADNPSLSRSSYDDVTDYIVDKLNNAIPNLQSDWHTYASSMYGRINKGMAMALKSRVLLYWASPQHNTSGDITRWQKAAQAAKDVIDMGKYSLASEYASLFIGATAHQSSETIFCNMTGSNNNPETYNYPISTNGGQTGTCPSGNLVDDYENSDGSAFSWAAISAGRDPYANRDSRLKASIVVNNSTWNGRTIECYSGGADGPGTTQCSTTGYYLRKFLTDGLDLKQDQTSIHSWILFRYGEILLNYAEAMNEAYGPDGDHFNDGKTARWAVNQIRSRSSMPNVVTASQAEMRDKIKHERRIELAFENHRFWDVRRWGESDAANALGADLKGVTITMSSDSTFSYVVKTVESRKFESKMMLYPIPQSEILNSDGKLTQNFEW